MSSSDSDDQPVAAQEPQAGPPARERSGDIQGESASQVNATAALLDAIKLLTNRIDVIERAVTPSGLRQGAVSPDQRQQRRSIFRQAIEHGSMGMQRMQLDELGDGHRYVQTPGDFARDSFYGGVPLPQYQEHRPPPVPTGENNGRIPPAQAPQYAGGEQPRAGGDNPPFGYPNYGQSKLSIRDFDGKKTYKGLGAGFEQWGLMFIGQVDMAERACEEVKLNKLGEHLVGKAGRFFREQANTWWTICLFLFYALELMNATFTVRLSMQDAAVMFTAPKDSGRSWNDHFLYLIALMRATDASPAMVLQNIIRHASPRFSPTLLGRYNEARPDLMLRAQELVQFAQRFDTDAMNRKETGKDREHSIGDAKMLQLREGWTHCPCVSTTEKSKQTRRGESERLGACSDRRSE
ncbi:Mitochondrial Carrier (MC) protein [Phytophthora megakarya]|uniref:Mitochondrial Carrier (MC) protein n=1 Tax=Phytophthora megakarya TaxID=4795 RepID=A0A225UKB2_9STRA|nr:Mitochondrial Carrier (MC) protein [Phytophthora megakarya]